MINYVLKHPLSIAFFLCLLLFITAGTFFGSGAVSDAEGGFFLISLFCICCGKDFSQRILLFFVFAFGAICYLLISSAYVMLTTELVLFITLWQFNKSERQTYLFFITAAAFLLHLFYIQNTPADIRQHDLSGIILYMRLITKNGINWSGFDPWYMYYLFHQPLHFIIYGYIYLSEISLWQSHHLAINGLQYISLFYVTGTTIIAALIFAEMRWEKTIYHAVFLIFAFNPTLTLFSGYISDDTPLLFWSCTVIYFLLLWFKDFKTRHLTAAALCFGIGTLTKLSMLMLVPAISFLFLYILCTHSDKQKTIQQLSIFVIIAVPLSLLWVIRNHVLFDMPFYHVPDTSPEGQNFRYLTFVERMTDFTFLFKPFINAPHAVDSNIWLSIIKTELFGEWDLSLNHKEIYLPAVLLYVLNIIIKILSFCGCFYLIFQKSFKQKHIMAPIYFFAIFYVTIWGYSFKYATDYPYACSCDYRLFSQLILPELMIVGLLFQHSAKANYLRIIAICYAVLSFGIYIFSI